MFAVEYPSADPPYSYIFYANVACAFKMIKSASDSLTDYQFFCTKRNGFAWFDWSSVLSSNGLPFSAIIFAIHRLPKNAATRHNEKPRARENGRK